MNVGNNNQASVVHGFLGSAAHVGRTVCDYTKNGINVVIITPTAYVFGKIKDATVFMAKKVKDLANAIWNLLKKIAAAIGNFYRNHPKIAKSIIAVFSVALVVCATILANKIYLNSRPMYGPQPDWSIWEKVNGPEQGPVFRPLSCRFPLFHNITWGELMECRRDMFSCPGGCNLHLLN